MSCLFVVGEPKVARTVLTDALSEKPLEIYGNFRKMYGGTALMFTMNGDGWHSKRKAVAHTFLSNHVKRMTQVAMEKTEMWIRDTLMGPDKSASFELVIFMFMLPLSEAFRIALNRKKWTSC